MSKQTKIRKSEPGAPLTAVDHDTELSDQSLEQICGGEDFFLTDSRQAESVAL